jgi:pimeloyl-ACP methyl ester carboxylesterase
MMRDCVLVHGAWCGGWYWEEVAARLRLVGVRVHVPTLTGLAERAAEATDRTDLTTHVDEIAALLRDRDLRDVVLVGHSYGGAVITGVAHRGLGRIAELVYFDAFVPRDGESLADMLGAEFVAQARNAAAAAGTPHLLPPMLSIEASVGWTGPRAEALAARMCPQPIASLFDPLHAPGAPEGRRSFIYCAAQPLGIFDRYAAQARGSADWRYFELPSPHDVVLVMPAVVAGIIEDLAAGLL